MPSHLCHQLGAITFVNKVPSGANFTRAHVAARTRGQLCSAGQGVRCTLRHRTHGGLGQGAIARACTSAGLALALGSRPAESGASASTRPMNTCALRARAWARQTRPALSERPASRAASRRGCCAPGAHAPQAQAAARRPRAHMQQMSPQLTGRAVARRLCRARAGLAAAARPAGAPASRRRTPC